MPAKPAFPPIVFTQSGVYEKFAEMVKEHASKIVVGHGSAPGTTMGPSTSPRGLDKVLNQIDDATKLGAKVILGGHRVSNNPGYFTEPTIIMDMTPEMLISREESFAPILALYKFETEEEATKVANDTSMGLASYVFTKDVDRIWRMFESLEAGMVGLNFGKYYISYLSLVPIISDLSCNRCSSIFYNGNAVRRYQEVRLWQGTRQACY